MSHECLAVIPARGGSKGIPRKNLESVGGCPLVVRTVRAALGAALVDRVIVSTEDSEIAGVALAAGAEVVERPMRLAGDTATSESALIHALDHLRERDGYEPDLLVFLQCTSPLCLSTDIDGAIETLLEADADSCMTVTPFHGFLWELKGRQATAVGHDSSSRPRRQDRDSQYQENGAVYVMRTQGFRAAGHRFFGKIIAHVMPSQRSIEVDEPLDLALADALSHYPAVFRDILPKPVEALVMDFDGVFTDNRALVLGDGVEGVLVHRGDGLGLSLIRDRVPVVVLSTEKNPVVAARCSKLGLECHQGIDDKAAYLQEWLKSRDLASERAVFVGNDVNDLGCMRLVGCGIAVADAHPQVVRAARHVLVSRGGKGAIREVAEMIDASIQGAPSHSV